MDSESQKDNHLIIKQNFLIIDSNEKVLIDDIVGVEMKENLLLIHCYPIKVDRYCGCFCLKKNQKNKIRTYQLIKVESNSIQQIELWYHQINEKLCNKLNMLILINPASGAGKAEKIWKNIIKIFHHAQHQFHVIKTEHAGHAYEYIKNTIDIISLYDSIVIISGDGLVSEVLQGIMNRKDWDQLVQNLTIGVIPAGSGNGLSTTCLHESNEYFNALNAAYIICKNYKRKMDLFTVKHLNNSKIPIFYGFLGLAWGIISDIDFESEWLRCIGKLRFDVYALIRFLNLKKYHGRIEYLLPNEPISKTTTNDDFNELKQFQNQLFNPNNDEIKENPKSWQMVNGPFILSSAWNIPYASSDLKIAPYSQVNDGLLDLVYVNIEQISLLKLIKAFTACEHGTHVTNTSIKHYFNYIKVKEFKFYPGTNIKNTNQTSSLSIDGECIKYGPIHLKNYQSILTIFFKIIFLF